MSAPTAITAHLIELRLENTILREQVIRLTSELAIAQATAVIDAARLKRAAAELAFGSYP